MILAKFMFRKLGYDPLKDFDAISLTVDALPAAARTANGR